MRLSKKKFREWLVSKGRSKPVKEGNDYILTFARATKKHIPATPLIRCGDRIVVWHIEDKYLPPWAQKFIAAGVEYVHASNRIWADMTASRALKILDSIK